MNEQIKMVKYEFGGNTVLITLIRDFFVMTSDILNDIITSYVYLAEDRAWIDNDGTLGGIFMDYLCHEYCHTYDKTKEHDIEKLHRITVKELLALSEEEKIKCWESTIYPDGRSQPNRDFSAIAALYKTTVIDFMEDDNDD